MLKTWTSARFKELTPALSTSPSTAADQRAINRPPQGVRLLDAFRFAGTPRSSSAPRTGDHLVYEISASTQRQQPVFAHLCVPRQEAGTRHRVASSPPVSPFQRTSKINLRVHPARLLTSDRSHYHSHRRRVRREPQVSGLDALHQLRRSTPYGNCKEGTGKEGACQEGDC